MRRIVAAAMFLALGAIPRLQAAPVTSLAQLVSISNEQAAASLPVDFDATVTFYRTYEGTLFVQDGDSAIYVQPIRAYALSPGDRVHIHGVTQSSFRPIVAKAAITVLSHGARPAAPLAVYDELIHARFDCRFVRIRGTVLSADISSSSDHSYTNVQLLVDGGTVEVQIDANNPEELPALLDAEVEISGVISGRFDGKMEMTGIVLHTQSMADLKVMKPQQTTPWTVPLTPIDQVISASRLVNQSGRVRVHGVVTYFMPGSVVVLQNGGRSLWIHTRALTGVQIGHETDATGFPDVHDGFLRLADGEFLDRGKNSPLEPISVTWNKLSRSLHVFDLVSIDSQVVAEVREGGQDEYVLVSDGHLFSAILRRPPHTSTPTALDTMKHIQTGSRVRVTGICILEDSNPFNADVPFNLLLRSTDDIAVIARPSPVNIENLLKAVGLLAILVITIFAWGWMLKRKVERQTRALARRIEAEAAMERFNAQIEQRRSRILEDINGSRPLAEVLEEITELLSFCLKGAPSWCEITDGPRLGRLQAENAGRRMVRDEIPARSGPPLGRLCAALAPDTVNGPEETQAFYQCTRLATLAIETRRLYSDLVHRSEFDLLTDVHNRFSLEKQLDALVARAREEAGVFGLIYVDLDEFKQVNDVYGHRIGDLYLQEVSTRMKHQLRSHDILARLGGDEFAILVPGAHTRADLQEIALRLERCFDEPFCVEGCTLEGSASVGIALYPEDGGTRDSLLSSADAAMYVSKHTAGTARRS
jgi:diguanylate cyclase (GGDEF)-like protein